MTTLTIPNIASQKLYELDALEDKDLWHIVHTAMNRAEQDETPLTPADDNQAQKLLYSYDEAILIRAKAMALLKKRGHDISFLQQSHFNQ